MGILERWAKGLAKRKVKKAAKQFYVKEVRGWGKERRHMRPPNPPVKPCDLYLTTSETWPSRLVRWGSRSEGEDESQVSHVGLVTTAGALDEAQGIEALWEVTEHRIWEARRRTISESVAVFRPTNLTTFERRVILEELRSHIGQRYGWWKLLFHLAAKLTGKRWPKSFFFLDDRPICSHLVATAFEKAGLTFGVEGRSADPDDIWDFILSNPDKYRCVRPLQLI